MNKYHINIIDFLKLDVEGVNWEVLDGFGNRLKYIYSVHIEAEHTEVYESGVLWEEIRKKLENAGFEMIYFQRYSKQSDSFWIQKKVYKAVVKK